MHRGLERLAKGNELQQRLHYTSSTLSPGGIWKLCVMEEGGGRGGCFDMFCDYTKVWETRSLGYRVFANFSPIALILNSSVYWEFQQFQMKQSLASRELQNNHKPI